METSKIAMVTISMLALIGAVFAVLLSTNVINLDKITAVGGENKLTIVYPNDNESAVKWTDLSDGEVAQFMGVIDGTLDLDESDIQCVVVADGVTYELTLKYIVEESGTASYSGETYVTKEDNTIHFCFSILNGYDMNFESGEISKANKVIINPYWSVSASSAEFVVSEFEVTSLVQGEVELIGGVINE